MVTILKVILVLGVVVVVAAGAAGVFIVTSRCQQPPLSKDMRVVVSSPGAASSFDNKMRDLESRARGGQKSDVQVTEQEVTSKISAMSLPLKDVQVNFLGRGQKSRVTARWESQGFTCPVAMEAVARVGSGQVQMNIETLQVGVVGVPGPVTDQVRGVILGQAANVKIPEWISEAWVSGDGVATVSSK